VTYLSRYSKQILSALGILAIFMVALYVAQMLTENDMVVSLVERLGYVGVLLTGIVAGLNTIVPLHAATFTPLFIGAGLTIPLIILTLAVGTLIADSIGFALGHVSRDIIEDKYPKLFNFFTTLATEHSRWVVPIVILYASFVPFPNEALLIPLALAGVAYKRLILPLIVGNIIHQTLAVYGVASATDFLF
jgi:membrane protein YqaA with SNARE-associated domain